jgi:hypothetical protein
MARSLAGAEAPHKTSGTGRPYALGTAVIVSMLLVGQGSVPAFRPAQRPALRFGCCRHRINGPRRAGLCPCLLAGAEAPHKTSGTGRPYV